MVTANKMLLAAHGPELLKAASRTGVQLRFEAAVGGGVPLIHGVREGLAGDSLTGVAGILNGTCNYILSRMSATGEPMDIVLADAQRLGYAEADPTRRRRWPRRGSEAGRARRHRVSSAPRNARGPDDGRSVRLASADFRYARSPRLHDSSGLESPGNSTAASTARSDQRSFRRGRASDGMKVRTTSSRFTESTAAKAASAVPARADRPRRLRSCRIFWR